jgi:hypothetical protein
MISTILMGVLVRGYFEVDLKVAFGILDDKHDDARYNKHDVCLHCDVMMFSEHRSLAASKLSISYITYQIRRLVRVSYFMCSTAHLRSLASWLIE